MPTIPDVEFNEEQITAMTTSIDGLIVALTNPDLTDEKRAELESELEVLIAQRDELQTISGLLKKGFNITDFDDRNDHVGDPMKGHASGMEPVEATQEQTNKAAARKEFND